jgi:ketosteroid isomerase-like protein
MIPSEFRVPLIRRIRLVALIVMSGIPCTVALARQTNETAAITRLEQLWDEAHLRGDAAALEQLWADDLEVVVPRMAPMSKGESLAFARSGRMTFQRYKSSDIRVRTYGDTAIVTGRLERQRTIAGRQLEDSWRYTKVYVRKDGTWKVVGFHASEAAPN